MEIYSAIDWYNISSKICLKRDFRLVFVRQRPPCQLLDKFIGGSGYLGQHRKESEKRVKSKLQKCNSADRCRWCWFGGKTNIIRRLLRICTMSTSTVGWCNNCSFSAKKMHFGALARCAQGRSDGLGCSTAAVVRRCKLKCEFQAWL